MVNPRVRRVGPPAGSCQTQSTPTSHIPLPAILHPGQFKLGCDSEHLSHRKAISQLAMLVDCIKLSSPENSESNVISHHYIYAMIKKKKVEHASKGENIASHKTKLEKKKLILKKNKNLEPVFILILPLTLTP